MLNVCPPWPVTVRLKDPNMIVKGVENNCLLWSWPWPCHAMPCHANPSTKRWQADKVLAGRCTNHHVVRHVRETLAEGGEGSWMFQGRTMQ